MTNSDGTLDHLNRVIEARGRGGAFSVAVDLGVDPSIVSHWRARRRTPSPDMTQKIKRLPVIDSHDSDARHDSDADHDTDDTNDDRDDDNGAAPVTDPSVETQTVNAHSLEDLEAVVLSASPQDRIEVGTDSLDARPAIPPPSTEWRQQVWLPVNDMIAGFVGPPGGPLIAAQARSGHGNLACEASERVAHRMGLEEALRNGHWMADLAIMGSYVIAVIKIARSGQTMTEAA